MSKKKSKTKAARKAVRRQPPKKWRWPLVCCGALLVLCVALVVIKMNGPSKSNVTLYKEKLNLLAEQVLAEKNRALLGNSPAGGQAGQAVFLSVCNGEERAMVFSGVGADLDEAWKTADAKVTEFLLGSNYNPVWVKADVVSSSDTLLEKELVQEVIAARHEFYRYGVAFDKKFETALLEAELNGAKIYDYDNGGISLDYLNRYLVKSGRTALEELPQAYTVFQCLGWFCDEDKTIYDLSIDELDYGRRQIASIDAGYAKELILTASSFLLDQVKADGSFVYGMYPRFDNEIENYNIVRHASTVWSLICRYRIEPDEALKEKIEAAISYMLDHVIYDPQGRAYLYEEKDDEIKLGGCGVAVIALTEYMEVFQSDAYKEECCALGEGILTMLDQRSGEFYHVLHGDFTRKEEFRTVYYDGEASFALSRLYSLTGDSVWLEAAKSVVEHFIREDYTQYKDHWVAYCMNEITKHITDKEEYYAFALRNAQNNLKTISERDTTYHTYLELLMATFEVYDRMCENGYEPPDDFDLPKFLETVSVRVNRQLNGYFYPEYAMYMANPKRILNTFMVRHDGYRVRIDDVQHNIGGFYLYYKNYDKLVSYGLQ